MLAQAYFDGIKEVRIFGRGSMMIASLPLDTATNEAADKALRKMKLARREKWREASWPGMEAKVRFVR